MKVLELRGDATGEHALELHPRLTVVHGADAARRAWLTGVLGHVAAGRGLAATGLIEVEGIRFDLDDRTLELLGLDEPRDAVVSPGALTGPGDVLDLDHARARHRDAMAAASAAAAALEEARSMSERDWSDPARSLAEARHHLEDAERTVAVLDPGEGASPVRLRLAEVAHRRIELVRMQEAMGPSQAERVDRALDRVLAAQQDGPPLDEALTLADDWRAVHQQIDALDVGASGPEQAARQRVATAVRAVAEAEADHGQPLLTADQVRKLEEMHTRALEAQDRADGRFAGARARRQLEDARAEERRVLERLGFSTYADYLMSSSSGSARGSRALLEARAELVAAETALAAIDGAGDRAQRRRELDLRREGLVARITPLLGHKPIGPDTEAELRSLRATPTLDEEVLGPLAARLLEIGLDLGPRPHRVEDLVTAARAYLADERTAELRRSETREAIAALDAAIDQLDLAVREQVEELPVLPPLPKLAEPAAPDPAARPMRLVRLGGTEWDEVTVAREALAEAERIVRLEAGLADASRLVEETRVALAAAEANPRPAPGSRPVTLLDGIHWSLLQRMAANRVPGPVGSVPLVLDEPFVDLGDGEVVELLDRLALAAGSVQVVVLTDRPGVLAWAADLSADQASVVSA